MLGSTAAVFALAGITTAVVLLGDSDTVWQSALAGLLLTTAVALSAIAALLRHRVAERRIARLRELTVRQAAEAARLEAERARLEHEHRELLLGREALADEETLMRGRVHDVFVNLSMRTLTLVERQLDLIEKLEHGEDEPQRLQDLFRLDHLATRMRRNSENLLVLADADERRGRRPPIPLLDVVRAGVSEIERYERIDVGHVPRVEVLGRTADDIGHLLAELLENAAAYSAPESRVEIGGWTLENGEVVLSVDDNGIGVPADRLTELNGQIERDSAEEEAASGGGLGVFVVGRLARRHGVRVQLRPRPQGGLSAVVVIPATAFNGIGPSPAEFSAERDREQERERDRMTLPGVAPGARAIPPGAVRLPLPAAGTDAPAGTRGSARDAAPARTAAPVASPVEGGDDVAATPVPAVDAPAAEPTPSAPRGPVVPREDATPPARTTKGLPKRTPSANPEPAPGADAGSGGAGARLEVPGELFAQPAPATPVKAPARRTATPLPVVRPTPTTPQSPAAADGAGPAVSEVGRTRRGLPKRLVAGEGGAPAPAAPGRDSSQDTGSLSADELRRRLTGFQEGLQAARREDGTADAAAPAQDEPSRSKAREETGGGDR